MRLVMLALALAGCAEPVDPPFVFPDEEREAALRYAEEVPFTFDAAPLKLFRPDEPLEFALSEPGYGGHELGGAPRRLTVFVKAGADQARVVSAAEARWCTGAEACREPTFPIVVPYSVLEQRAVMGWLKASPIGKYCQFTSEYFVALPGFAGVASLQVQEELLGFARELLERGGVPSDAYRLNKLRPYLPTTGATAPTGG